ncbi:aldehyde dehydrogenase family protein [Plantibacter sp. RU18]|uniref:aldehyde dehydrogenase family protein n=1 Tax=Plantibacter sp. RU18 TaxID=3158143 RepID=UPI003D3608D0
MRRCTCWGGLDTESVWSSAIAPGVDLSVFLPSNNLLYSYVLYALVPSTWGANVRLRPSSRVKQTYFNLRDIFRADVDPSVRLVDETQKDFVSAACSSDIVVFTGSPTNGQSIARALSSEQTLLGMGSGPNPTVVGPDASVGKAVHDAVVARLYNGGQDCLCSDVIFVQRDKMDDFEQRLVATLERVPAATRATAGLINSPLVYQDAFDAASAWLAESSSKLRWQSSSIDEPLFVPSSVVRNETIATADVREFFSPIFNLVAYDRPSEVRDWLEAPEQSANGFYLSVYGEPSLAAPVIGNAVNCADQSALDSEDGNAAFGGYGINASWISHRGESWGTPILLSRETARYSRLEQRDSSRVA